MASTIAYSLYNFGSVSGEVVAVETANFAYDATPSALNVYETTTVQAGHLSGVGVKFGTTAPNTLTVTVKDSSGITIASGTLTASGRLDSFAPQPFVGSLTATITGNTTASATGSVSLYVF